MAEPSPDLARLSPDKLVARFARSKILGCIVLALAIHIVFAGATSVTFIRDRWIDPEGAAQRKKEQEAAAKAAQEDEEAEPEDAAPASAPTQAKSPESDAQPPDGRKDAPIVKETTDLPEKGEIPTEPDLGISIDETNK
jgi:hypothetical protein